MPIVYDGVRPTLFVFAAKRFENLAKIVNIAIQFRKIHSYPLHFRFLARNDGEDNFLRLFAPIAVS